MPTVEERYGEYIARLERFAYPLGSEPPMVADHVIGARDVGKTFAESVKEDPAVVGVWARRYRDVFEVWVLTDPIDSDHERKLYAEVGALHDAFPYALIRVHLLNPVNFEGGAQEDMAAEELPGNAELILSRRE